MPLVSLQDITIAFGGPPALDGANLAIEAGDRIALLGRNGAGKSTLMQILDGTLAPDSGVVVRSSGVSIARLTQEIPRNLSGTVTDIVLSGLGPQGALLAAYHDALARVAIDHSDTMLSELDKRQRSVDAVDAWHIDRHVEVILQQLGLDGTKNIEGASGGQIRQTLFAKALAANPNVLLLDEPTNHLDIDAIEWMEQYLLSRKITIMFVTHDRSFLRRVATRVVELDRGKLIDFGSSYETYLVRKEAALHAESMEWEAFDRKLAQEEVWIRTGIQARRTRNEGRVRALEAMRVERSRRRNRTGSIDVQLQEAERSGRLVMKATSISFAYNDKPIIHDFSTTIMRGDRIAIIGPNGSGKSTLVRLLLGELPPDVGQVRHGTNLEVVYYDQLREQLDSTKSIIENISADGDWVLVGSERKHIYSYLQDFLFTAERSRTPVSALSGGERNRVLLARLFTKQCNVLVLDEPTNDLDMETLDVLESLLESYTGTLILVSHDRDFIDAVATSTLVMESSGRVGEYVGGYSDWVRQRKTSGELNTETSSTSTYQSVRSTDSRTDQSSSPSERATASDARGREKKRKLSFKENKELEGLPERIERYEKERDNCYQELTNPEVLRDGARVAALRSRVAELDTEIPFLMDRWVELESLR